MQMLITQIIKPLYATTSNYKQPITAVNTEKVPRGNGVALESQEKKWIRGEPKGLCFWCEEKYTPNHHFPKKSKCQPDRQLLIRKEYVMHMLEEEVGGEPGEIESRIEWRGWIYFRTATITTCYVEFRRHSNSWGLDEYGWRGWAIRQSIRRKEKEVVPHSWNLCLWSAWAWIHCIVPFLWS